MHAAAMEPCMLLADLRQAGRLPFREGGGQYEAPNSVDVNNGGQKVNKLELEETSTLCITDLKMGVETV